MEYIEQGCQLDGINHRMHYAEAEIRLSCPLRVPRIKMQFGGLDLFSFWLHCETCVSFFFFKVKRKGNSPRPDNLLLHKRIQNLIEQILDDGFHRLIPSPIRFFLTSKSVFAFFNGLEGMRHQGG